MGNVVLKQVAKVGKVADVCLVPLHDKKWSSCHGIGWRLQDEYSVCLEREPHVCNMHGWGWLGWVGFMGVAGVGGALYSLTGDKELFKGT